MYSDPNRLVSIAILFSLFVFANSCGMGAGGDGGGGSDPPQYGGIEGTWDSNDASDIPTVKVILTDGDKILIEKSYEYSDLAYSFGGVPVGDYAVVIDTVNAYWEIIENIQVDSGKTTVVNNINLRTIKATAPLVPSIINIANNEENVSLKYNMESSPFIDGLSDDSHNSTRWQLSTGEHFLSSNLVFDELTASDLLLFNPEIILSSDFIYYCRVKHIDSSIEESRWSDTITFKTEIDEDNDGMSDAWEDDNDLARMGDLSPSGDPDGDNIPNRFEYYFGLDPNEDNSKGSSGLQTAITGNIYDYRTKQKVIADIIVKSDIGRTIAKTANEGGYFGIHPSGTFNISIITDYYYPRIFRNIIIPETDNHQLDFNLIPMNWKDEYTLMDDGDPDSDTGPNNGGGGGGCFVSTIY